MANLFSRILSRIGTGLAMAAIAITGVATETKPAEANQGVRYSNNGISLNVNPAFGRKHGAILGSQFTDTPNDREQLFNEKYINHDTFLMESQSYPGMCGNAYQAAPGSTINFYPCNSNDGDMHWKKQGNRPYHAGTGLFLNIGSQNNSIVRFSSERAGSSVSQPNPSPQKKIANETFEYEYWLAADKDIRKTLLGDIGHHVFVAFIKRKVTIFSDGSKVHSEWIVDQTRGVWPDTNEGYQPNSNPFIIAPGGIKDNKESQDVDDILNSRVNGRYAVRKVKITESKRNWILNNLGIAGCDWNKYQVAGTGTTCSCSTFATRLWYVTTGEDFRHSDPLADLPTWQKPINSWWFRKIALDRDPLSVYNKINFANRDGGFAKNGQVLN